MKVKHKDVGVQLTKAEWEAEDTHVFTEENLGDLADVNVPSPTDGYALVWNAALGVWIASAPAPAAHKTSHQDGGADEISVAGLSGELADLQPPKQHQFDHQDGGADAISSALYPAAYPMLYGTLAARPAAGIKGRFYWTVDTGILYVDAITAWVKVAVSDYPDLDEIPSSFAPSAHKTSHQDGGTDEISLGGLAGDPADTINKSLLTAQGQIIIRNATAPAALAPGTSGQFLKTLGAAADPAWDAVDYPRKLKPNLTRWVLPGWAVAALGDQVPGAGVIYYVPIFVSELTTYDYIGVNVAGAGIPGSAAEMRVYNWNGGVPGTQVLNAGSVTTATTGERSIAITLSLARGYYFLALRAGGNADLFCPYLTPPPIVCPVQGIDTAGPFQQGFFPILKVTDTMTDPARAPTGVTDCSFIFCCLRESS